MCWRRQFCYFFAVLTLKFTSVVQIAGVSAPLLCYPGWAEHCVSASCQWLQEGEFFIFFPFALTCNVLSPPVLLTVSSVSQVILSTNIAESSVTVPDVKYGGSFHPFGSGFQKHVHVNSLFFFVTVIDFCLTRRMVCDQDTNFQFLCLTWASKTSCNQRRGTTLPTLLFIAMFSQQWL